MVSILYRFCTIACLFLPWLACFASQSAVAQTHCADETAELRRIANGVRVDISVPSNLNAGGALTVSWRANQRFPQKLPVYIVLAAPGEVRVDIPSPPTMNVVGNPPDWYARLKLPGVIALSSGSRGPLNLVFGAGRSRILVPLYQPGSKLDGSFDLRLFAAGVMTVEAAVLGLTACGERMLASLIRRELDVLPGSATIVVQDPFDLEAPKRIITSNSGRYRAHIFDGRYRIYDASTGAKLVDRAGHNPNFSPGERFAVANIGPGSGYRFEVLDLISLEVIDKPYGPVLGWTHGDSFIIDGSVSGAPSPYGRL